MLSTLAGFIFIAQPPLVGIPHMTHGVARIFVIDVFGVDASARRANVRSHATAKPRLASVLARRLPLLLRFGLAVKGKSENRLKATN
jgi:hypothetical protein